MPLQRTQHMKLPPASRLKVCGISDIDLLGIEDLVFGDLASLESKKRRHIQAILLGQQVYRKGGQIDIDKMAQLSQLSQIDIDKMAQLSQLSSSQFKSAKSEIQRQLAARTDRIV